MFASPTPTARPARDAAATPAPTRRVTDAPMRMFHVLFGLSFAGAYLTADSEHWRALHVTLGYAFGGLLVFRLGYGLFGPRQARLGLLWRRVAGLPAWLGTLRSAPGAAPVNWRQGQNLAMAAAMVAMLALVLPLTLSGYANLQDWGEAFGGEALEELHEFLGNLLLGIVLAHLALIAGLSLLRRQNLALPMLTGRVRGAGPNLAPHNRRGLAALLLLAVLGLGVWQWAESPQGLIPLGREAGAATLSRGDRHSPSQEEEGDD